MKRKPVEVTWEQLVAAIEGQRPEMLRVACVGGRSDIASAQLVLEALCRRAFDAGEQNVVANTDGVCSVAGSMERGSGGAWCAYRSEGGNRVFVGPTACAAAHACAVGIKFGDGILSPETPLGASPSSEARGSHSKGTEDTTR